MADTARPLQADLARLAGLSDGVFAIVLTLLVLDLKVPASLGDAHWQRELLSGFVTFVVTFVAMALLWVSHNRLLSAFSRIDRRLQYLNLAFLFPLSLLPFLTSFLGHYPFNTVAQELYGLCMVLLGVLLWTMWRHAITRQLLDHRIGVTMQRYQMWRALDSALVFVLWCVVAWANPHWTPWTALLLPLTGWLISFSFPREDAADEDKDWQA